MHEPYRLKHLPLVVCLACCLLPCVAEIFSSVSKMKTLPRLERRLLTKFEDFLQTVHREDGAADELRRKLQKLHQWNSKIVKNTSIIECPLHAFRLVKRLVRQWSAVFKLADDVIAPSVSRFKEFTNSTREWLRTQQIWPTHADLSGAATAIVRLHHLYNLDYAPLLQGHFLNVTSKPLTSLELTYVTKAALKLGFICDAKGLFSALETLSAGFEGERTVARVQRLRERLSDLMIGSMSECEHNNSISTPSVSFLASEPEQRRKEAVRTLYHQMCRKSMQAAIVHGSGTRCYLHSTQVPYLKFKAEVVNYDPYIVVFHDVISDDEIREMKDLSFGKLSPSTLAVAQVAHEQQLIRVSQNAWLFDTSPVVSRVSRRVELITRLSTRILHQDTHAEPYQVTSYGVGGVNGLHEDSVRVPRHNGNENTPLLRNSGDRTATWMYYLSDVQLGGATVFPLLGASIRPQKGTAAFWYNLKHSGEGDVRMVHAGCPVLYGDKWVANKWLREVGNVFTRPCLLHPHL
ncbi:prolyl 4-hydroxylase subunit alpha-2-like isoform X2 [Littorina saxatilis]|uniref:prolyl 4-hydroxylase subunit alpha-2-like isoform X2 n=1 Tax=Littorina saxatilis TaxID=31220 RepID=UPI0038B651A5